MANGISKNTNMELRATLRSGYQRRIDNLTYWVELELRRHTHNERNRRLLPETPARRHAKAWTS